VSDQTTEGTVPDAADAVADAAESAPAAEPKLSRIEMLENEGDIAADYL
jgi:hypothetical protein